MGIRQIITLTTATDNVQVSQRKLNMLSMYIIFVKSFNDLQINGKSLGLSWLHRCVQTLLSIVERISEEK